MLTISIDRIGDLLDKASDVDVPQPVLGGDTDEEKAPAVGGLAEALADDPAYRQFVEALAALTAGELYDLLALSLLARNDGSPDEWPTIAEEAREFPEETILDELACTLLLTDEIETALERLGYSIQDEEDEEGEDEELDGDERKDKAEE